MTTTTRLNGMTDEDLVEQVAILDDTVRRAREQRQALETEIFARLQARNAREMPHPTYKVALEEDAPTYDVPRMIPVLGEVIPPDEWAKAFSEAHEETVQVPARLDMRVARYWADRYGDDVRRVFDEARIPGATRLKVTPRKPVR